MAIIGISGKIGSGKDTVGKIIQYLTSGLDKANVAYDVWDGNTLWNTKPHDWQIHKFADALKDIICILTGCTREQLEDIKFKDSKLSDEWIRYGYANGFSHIYNRDMDKTTIMNNKQCDKKRYEEELRINWQTAYKSHLTYRELLQYLGTDLLRNQLHENVWVNALMKNYIPKKRNYSNNHKVINEYDNNGNISKESLIVRVDEELYPNWIITDVRFENEANAIKEKGGINIRVNRDDYIFDNDGKRIIPSKTYTNIDNTKHASETSLDDYSFDYVIDNNGTIEELIQKVKEILIKEHII